MAKLKLSRSQRKLLAVVNDSEWQDVPGRFRWATVRVLIEKGLLLWKPKDLCTYGQIKRVKISELLAREFHRAYEDLAPRFSYKTRKASAVPWNKVPENNRDLMIAVCKKLLGESGLIAWMGP